MSVPAPARRWLSHIEPEQFERLLRVTLPVSVLSTIGAVIMAMQYLGGIEATAVMIWLLAFTAVSLARVGSGLYYLRTLPRRTPTPAWVQWALGSTLVHGALWGVFSAVVPVRGTPEAESLMHVILVAVAMGAAVHLSSVFPVLVGYVVLVIGPLAIRDFLIGGNYHLFLGVLSVLIGIYALVNGRSQARMIEEILAQRQRNAELIEALRQENVRTDAARRSAEQANAAKARFFAAANHDLRQPLNAMGLLAQTLHTQGRAARVEEVSGHLVECVDGMTQVVDDLLEISRLDVGAMAPQWSRFALGDLLHELVPTYAAMAEDKGLHLELQVPPVVVRCDRALLARVVSNLVANAIRYTSHGSVRVIVEPLDDHIALRVEDTGIGMAADELPRIFEEFYQIGNPARDRRLGLGLGLATVRRLSDLLGLDVQVRSQPSVGSVFSLTLQPADPEGSAGDAEAAPTDAPPLTLQHRVLVIEDDADSRRALLGLLASWGCHTRGVASADDALACIRDGFRPDVLLVDLRLADGASGIDAMHAVRSLLGTEVPGLIITGDVGSAHMHEAQARGHTVLVKPIKPMQLRAFLAQAPATA